MTYLLFFQKFRVLFNKLFVINKIYKKRNAYYISMSYIHKIQILKLKTQFPFGTIPKFPKQYFISSDKI